MEGGRASPVRRVVVLALGLVLVGGRGRLDAEPPELLFERGLVPLRERLDRLLVPPLLPAEEREP